jgi:hypothetical protein
MGRFTIQNVASQRFFRRGNNAHIAYILRPLCFVGNVGQQKANGQQCLQIDGRQALMAKGNRH